MNFARCFSHPTYSKKLYVKTFMLTSIQASNAHGPLHKTAVTQGELRERIIEDLIHAGMVVSDNQRTQFLNDPNTNELEILTKAGILTAQPKGLLNSAFANTLERKNLGALSFLFLGADPIIHDASGNNIFHIVCNQSDVCEEALIHTILDICKCKNSPPAYLLFEKNAQGKTPLDALENRNPKMIDLLKSQLYSGELQGESVERTLHSLLSQKYNLGTTKNERVVSLCAAAAQNEKNAQLELAKIQLDGGEDNAGIILLLTSASQAGLAEADYLLAMHTFKNEPVMRMRLLEKAVVQSHRYAQYEMARELIFNNGNQLETGLKLAKMAARQGIAEAENLACETAVRVGIEYLAQKKDDEAQVEFEYAAKRQYAAGQFYLGQHLLNPTHPNYIRLGGCNYLLQVLNNPACASSEQLLQLQHRTVITLAQHFNMITTVIDSGDIEKRMISTLEKINASHHAGAELKRNTDRTLKQILIGFALRSTATSRFRIDN